MAISVSAIKTAYVALGTLVAATKAAYATKAGRGARPTYPTVVVADADYNDVTTAITAWDAAIATDNAAINVAVAAQIVQELVVVNLLPANEWITLTTLTNWGGNVTQYIGYPKPDTVTSGNSTGNLFMIYTSATLPVRSFPLL